MATVFCTDGSGLLGTDGLTVEIYCGDHAEPVFGSINRRANLNGTPRIFGGKRLREWVQANTARGASAG